MCIPNSGHMLINFSLGGREQRGLKEKKEGGNKNRKVKKYGEKFALNDFYAAFTFAIQSTFNKVSICFREKYSINKKLNFKNFAFLRVFKRARSSQDWILLKASCQQIAWQQSMGQILSCTWAVWHRKDWKMRELAAYTCPILRVLTGLWLLWLHHATHLPQSMEKRDHMTKRWQQGPKSICFLEVIVHTFIYEKRESGHIKFTF